MSHLPTYLWAITYAEVAGMAVATAYALYRGARAAGLGNRVSMTMGLGAALLFGGWLAVSSLVAGGGSYSSRLGHGVPWLPLAMLGFFVLLVSLTRVPLIRRALSAPGAQQRLLSPLVPRSRDRVRDSDAAREAPGALRCARRVW